MRSLHLFFGLLCLIALGSCEKPDATQPTTNPTIQFRTGNGYTSTDDTVSMGDTLNVGVIINRGTDAMHHFKVTVSYDGGSLQVTDSLPMGTDSFEFDKVIITRQQAGMERWSFNVIENDGDVIRRSLHFTVQ